MSAAPEGFHDVRLIDPFEIHVGPAFATGEKGARRYAFRAEARHCNMRGVVHGGMLLTFADMTLGQAVWELTGDAPCVTLNMQAQFLKSAREGDLIETVPELTRRTGSLLFIRGDYWVGGERVMTASSVWRLFEKA
jgi:uncharacterized protein (TIGR00369 family)